MSECRAGEPCQVRSVVVAEIEQMTASHKLTEASPQKGVQVLNLLLNDPPLPIQITLLHSCQTLGLH